MSGPLSKLMKNGMRRAGGKDGEVFDESIAEAMDEEKNLSDLLPPQAGHLQEFRKRSNHVRSTKTAFLLTWICNTPFWAIFNMLPFILYKDLHATTFQITAIIALKPLVSLFSVYWSAWVKKRKDLLIKNVMLGTILGHLPFYFFPFVDNPWFFILSFGFYMLMSRGTSPAWMEILKLNVPDHLRGKTFAFASAFEYVGAGILPFLIGWTLDHAFQPWRWIFPVTATIALFALFFQRKIPIEANNLSLIKTSLKEKIISPWKNAWEILTTRPDFLRFQIGFMLGGAGLVIMQPALPHFFLDNLKLSYTELALAISLCKGIGYALTSSLWAKRLLQQNIFSFCSQVTILASLFPLCLVAAEMHLSWLYIAYLIYGVMQAGSTISWNLSGPMFSKEEDSSSLSSINVLAVGLRGCIVPIIGGSLAGAFGPISVMLIGVCFCLAATWQMHFYGRQRISESGQFG